MNEDGVEVVPAVKQPRSLALDVFRGLTVLLMLLVNNIALDTDTPEQLTHAPWGQGIRVADVVFPWFLLCVGLSIPWSQDSARRRDLTGSQVAGRVARRVVILFALGCLIQSLMHKELWISMDVLQLIALSYGLGYAVTSLKSPVRCIVPSLALVAYGLALSHLSYPGATGVVDAENNPIAWFNEQYLKAWKFEGLLSVIPGTVIVVIGCAAMENVKKGSKLSRNVAGGLALVAIGWLWSFDLTFSKQFWTPSYILVCSGLGVLLLSLFQVVDARPWFRAATWPFAVFGANPLVAYVLPILVKLTLLTWIVVPYRGESLSLVDALLKTSIDSFGRIPGGWVYTIVYIAVAWLIVVALNLRGAFVRA